MYILKYIYIYVYIIFSITMTTIMAKTTTEDPKIEHKANEKEEALPPILLPIGVRHLEKALPATRLLEKQRLLQLVHEELENQKIDFAQKEEILQKREDALREKDLKLQESLIGFSRFLQENSIKKKRAEKKSLDEIRIRQEKEHEILQVEEALLKLKEHRTNTLAHLERLMIYQKYLESVIEKATQFHEINDLILRHETLSANREDLRQHLITSEEQMQAVRKEYQSYLKFTATEVMMLNNDVGQAKQLVERKKSDTAQLQLQIDSMLQMAAAKTLAWNQICIAAENLFFRADKVSIISRPAKENPLKNLDMVSDFITDLNHVHKLYKGVRAPSPKPGI
ncbi:cilia- and flagella-associated protein 73 isoform X1 [Physcomitrium patens]|nr:cilia- and flagella-associated protein 73-like [Physcomitrium patens]|eukprot:XP_024357306.1 cilia- and flagella-associated protein 73-like [Physcomitrella patens]